MRNVFLEIGKSHEEIDARVEETFNEIFYGSNNFYGTTEDGSMGYLIDTGNNDTRTEGISYGMMMCVQLDKKKEFDQLWNWAMTNMYLDKGENKGYFAWSVATDGNKNAFGPAPDGEEFFAMSLIFASHRWGDGEGIYNYSHQAKELLRTCIHHEELYGGHNMWTDDGLIKFVPGLDFTDPSYHLPHFYDLFAENCYEEDSAFWKKAAAASREYLKKACHPVTGLSPEYSYYDGKPYPDHEHFGGRHDWFYSDAYRTVANLGLAYEWESKDSDFDKFCRQTANNLQRFFFTLPSDQNRGIYEIDGTILEGAALHPVGLTATIAQASLAADGEFALRAVEEFWNTPLRTGERRYYDNCLYMFAMLSLSGRYKIY
ncbi:oligosaccharide reducing-end xylanase [Pseudobutyrivibrio sp. OR37]|uniref:glycosyl hydrolase family 8 n=1 Tax=Pseudobutyrivibrio sp. OR37 TaxID=1798186 RepID=UPI0008E4B789|nr:glycosyl hydrolase family 8 [Pseudobutyrivibrio sp. OR37]SFH78438.1 oligosaccharide reducing-end xylanase [Pseudobutyrivibrio sp. OR37]